MQRNIKRITIILFSSIFIPSCNNEKDKVEKPFSNEIPAYRYAILNPKASISRIKWNDKLEYEDSLSYRSLLIMMDSFKKCKKLDNSNIYWLFSEDYAIAFNSLWRNVYYANNLNVPDAYLNEISNLKERYVLLVQYTGYVRHWTNQALRILFCGLNEISAIQFGDGDLLPPTGNMKVLAVDRVEKKIIYHDDRDLYVGSPVDSAAIETISKYFFGNE